MARTAPVPNIPPIPGMCPSIAVMAGGGGAGSGSGRGGGDGNGTAGGSGSGDGDGATDDGKAAGSGSACAPGAPGGSCPQHEASASRGDPVDVATGNVFTIPATDVWFRGLLHLVFCRRYRSELRRKDVGIGPGWTHSLDWRVEIVRSGYRVVSGAGTVVPFPELKQGEQAIGKHGWVLRREASGFTLLTTDEMVRRFECAHDDVWCLTSITFRGAHRIAVEWAAARIVEARDPAGRRLRFSYDSTGHVNALSALGSGANPIWRPLAEYTYSDVGDLIAATDSDGNRTSYEYDDRHLLVRATDATHTSTRYVYDREGRCIETWVRGTEDPDPALAPDEPHMLADGTTRAKGFFHCSFTFGPDGYVEVTDSRSTQRYFGNPDGTIDKSVTGGSVVTRTFDALGFESELCDPIGGVTRFERDARGNVTAWTDPLGRRREIARDDSGRVIGEKDPLGNATALERDAYGNPLRFVDLDEGVTSFRWEAGLMREVTHASGYRSAYHYDAAGDLGEMRGPGGSRHAFQYDEFGRLTAVLYPNGTEERYTYSVYGDVLSVRDASGAEWRFSYDGCHRLVAVEYPDGQRATIERGAFHLAYRLTKPDRTVTSLQYDREGRPKQVINALGQRHSYERSPEGFILRERTFDGRTIRHRYDPGRRVVSETHGRETTKMTYDAVGNLVECECPDGTTASYGYDDRDLLMVAKNAAGEVRFERDAAGRVVRETQTVGGEAISVESRYDGWGTRAERATSKGHKLAFHRQGAGSAKQVLLDDSLEVEVAHDALGHVSAYSFPAGGAIAFHFDEVGRLVGEEQRGPRSPRAKPESLPEFPGVPPALGLVKAWKYSRRGDLVSEWDRDDGVRYLEYDANGQVLARTDEQGRFERYSYDAAGNILSFAGDALRYEDGSPRPTHVGDVALSWDDNGRIVEKRDAGGAWRFEWSGRSELSSARRDGLGIEYAYDAIGRRIARRKYDRGDRLVEVARFVWDQGTVVHEIIQRPRDGTAEVEERTYWCDPVLGSPIAARDSRGEWRFALNDPSGAPHRWVDTAGGSDGPAKLGVFGQAATPPSHPFRFPGQMFDSDTGLAYNLFRWYDPSQGRYVSPDPLGIIPGLNVYRYAENAPTTFADPTGLAGATVGFLVLNDGSVIPSGGGMMPSGMPGSQAEGMTIPRNTPQVQAAIPRNVPNPPAYPPGVCVEAHLMSELQRAGHRPEDIAPGGMVILDARTGNVKPACPYCKPMLANLGVQPSQILQPGQAIPALPR